MGAPKTVNAISKANLVPLEKGKAKGRPPGSLNRTTTLMKKALVLAASRSKHTSETGKDLTAYLTFIADDYPETFAALLGRLIPEQSKSDRENSFREGDTIITLNMPVSQMVNVFEQRVKSSYMPKPVLVIDNDENESDA